MTRREDKDSSTSNQSAKKMMANESTSEDECMDVEFDEEDLERSGGDGKMPFIQSMIRQLRSGTPVYRIQLPIFLQEPRSLLERYSDFCVHLDYVLRLADLQCPEQRFLSVVKFYLSGWHTRPKDVRNPFNPILGEFFRCSYEHGDSTTHYIAEQISHHPPSTAFCIINEEKGLALNAYIRPSFRYRGNSLDTVLQGKLVGHLKKFNEDYSIGFPRIVVKGILVGAMQLTLAGSCQLSCPQSGYSAELDFKTKGLFKGKSNYVVAHIRHKSKKILYTIEGRWDDVLTMTNHSTNEKTVFLDVHNAPVSKQIIPPENKQEENESQKVWNKVTYNILKNNEDEALKEKTQVEEHQRTLEKERKKNGTAWEPKHFCKVSDDYYVHNKLRELHNGNKYEFENVFLNS